MPHFFKYAKDYKESSLEPINDSLVNKLEKIFKNKRIVYRNLPKVDYRILMDNPNTEIDEEVIRTYDRLNRTYHYKLNNKDSETNNINYIAQSIREELSQFKYSTIEITDMLVKYLYQKKTKNKSSLWFCYGYPIVRNIYKNINNKETYCLKCGKRFPRNSNQKYCDECKQEIISQNNQYRKAICVDCGEEFSVPVSNKRATRCRRCQTEYRRKIDREKKRKQRSK